VSIHPPALKPDPIATIMQVISLFSALTKATPSPLLSLKAEQATCNPAPDFYIIVHGVFLSVSMGYMVA
jgi:hypothetical protein